MAPQVAGKRNLTTARGTITQASLFENKETKNRSVMLRYEIDGEEGVGFLPLTDKIIGGASRFVGQTADARTRALLSTAVPSCLTADGKLNLNALEGAAVLLTLDDEDGGLVSVGSIGPREV